MTSCGKVDLQGKAAIIPGLARVGRSDFRRCEMASNKKATKTRRRNRDAKLAQKRNKDTRKKQQKQQENN